MTNSSNLSAPEPQATDESVTGATRVTFSRGPAPAAPEQPQQEKPAQPSIRIGNGALRINTSTGEQTNLGTIRASVSGAADPSGDSGILATARTPAFNGPAHVIKPETIVRVEGYDMEVKTAVQMGYLRRQSDGSYVETTNAQREEAEAAKRAAADAQQQHAAQEPSNGDVNKMTVQDFHPVIQSDLDQITQGKSRDEWGPILASYVQDGNLDHVVGRLGMGREQAQAFVGVAQVALMAQAQAALRDILGDDLEGWAAWCAENKASEYKRAVTNHIRAKTVDGYRDLAHAYLRSVVPSVEMLQRSGYEVQKDPSTGELLVKLEEGWVSVKAATKQGRFALPRAWHEEKE